MVDTGIPASFIPHDTSVARPSLRGGSGGGLNDLLLLVAIVIFVASAALAIGVFLYGQYLVKENTAKLEQLERAKAGFQPALIQQLTRLDDRMHAADRVLAAHIAPSIFFKALEEATLQTVSFRTLDFQVAENHNLSVKIAGIAESVNSIALQADLFSKNGVVTNPIFSNIARQPDGVHFNLSAMVNPSAINFAGSGASAGGADTTAPANSSPFDGPLPWRASTAQNTAALDKTAELQNPRQTLLSRFNTFDPADLDKLQKLLPDHVDNVRLILDLDNLAEDSGLALQNVDVSSAQKQTAKSQTALGAIGASNQKYDSLTLTFSTIASYPAFVGFLTDLESSLRIVDLVSLTITPSGNGTTAASATNAFPTNVRSPAATRAEPLYTFNMTLRTYWLK